MMLSYRYKYSFLLSRFVHSQSCIHFICILQTLPTFEEEVFKQLIKSMLPAPRNKPYIGNGIVKDNELMFVSILIMVCRYV